VTGLLMGTLSSAEASRADLVDGLKEGGRGYERQHAATNASAKILVGAQVALSSHSSPVRRC